MLWELLAADIEGVEGIGAVGAVFEEVFLGFGLFLHGFVLAELIYRQKTCTNRQATVILLPNKSKQNAKITAQ